MELHNLQPQDGATHNSKRIGRGQGSGKGGTATKGHKGHQSRSGFKNKRHHEGGQMPLQMRLPKRGFKNINREEYLAINLDQLQAWADKFNTKNLDETFYHQHHVFHKQQKIKVLAGGEIKSSIQVKAHAFSEAARKAIEDKGGTVHTF